MNDKPKSAPIKWYLRHKEQILRVLDSGMSAVCALTPQKKLILLESKPDACDNTYELFRCFIQKGINTKYEIVWLADEPEKIRRLNVSNVSAVPIHPKTLREKLHLRALLSRAAVIVGSHRFVFPNVKRKGQCFVYLDHGSPLKDCKNIYKNSVTSDTFYVSQSDFFTESVEDQYNITPDRILPLGLPRNDQLYREYDSIRSLIGDPGQYKKIVIWAPTFRYHESKERVDCHSFMPLGIPVFYTEEELRRFNEYLAANDTLVILKPHPAQNIELIVNLHCSHIRIVYSSELEENGIQTNELLAQTDALITDYSSIYYDYLQLDRPIALTLDDYEQYKAEMGFVFENPLDVLKGVYVREPGDMYAFIDSLLAGRDEAAEERRAIARRIDPYGDGGATKRVYDFIFPMDF